MLLAHMDEFGEVSVYHVGGGDMAYCFGPEHNGDEAEDIMVHQGFAVGDSGLYLASAHDQDVLLWQLGSDKPTLRGTITAHQAKIVQVRGVGAVHTSNVLYKRLLESSTVTTHITCIGERHDAILPCHLDHKQKL